jgi:mono/diheme cytochrome c family protein
VRRVAKVLGGLVVIVLVMVIGFYVWASARSRRLLTRTMTAHSVEFPIPFPLDPDERDEVGVTGTEAEGVALERAIDRGRHLTEARYGCAGCHGGEFGGGVMVDAFPLGTILGPNLTTGNGSRILDYTSADWDRAVRHGILPDGRPSAMPAEEFQLMSDRELSDIIAFIRSLPPVDNVVPPPELGPLGKILLAMGELPLSADIIESHDSPHPVEPPASAVTEEFGRHLAGVCTGCHGADLAGGPIVGGDPNWPPAANLTPAPAGLGDWSLPDFARAMREGLRPDGTTLQEPMTEILPFAQRMDDVELEALWLFLQSVPPVAGGT